MTAEKKRVAVVLFNLGGPDSLAAVRPFLFNLFNDPAIIGAPGPVRWCLAQFISRTRAGSSKKIYAEMGGASPLLSWTQRQGEALEAALAAEGVDAKTFIAMRYWRPLADETARQVKDFAPDEVVLLPLYPQFSTTTTGSSVADWRRAATAAGLTAPEKVVCCYPTQAQFIRAHANILEKTISETDDAVRILFSAHGLPERVIERGDPYQSQVEQTAAAVVADLESKRPGRSLDWVICYQSRVGPLKWIGPSTEDEIARAAADKVGIVLTPIAFVSEHVETLVELDIEYRELAETLGVPSFARAPALGLEAEFISSLASSVLSACAAGDSIGRNGDGVCDRNWTACPIALECKAHRAA